MRINECQRVVDAPAVRFHCLKGGSLAVPSARNPDCCQSKLPGPGNFGRESLCESLVVSNKPGRDPQGNSKYCCQTRSEPSAPILVQAIPSPHTKKWRHRHYHRIGQRSQPAERAKTCPTPEGRGTLEVKSRQETQLISKVVSVVAQIEICREKNCIGKQSPNPSCPKSRCVATIFPGDEVNGHASQSREQAIQGQRRDCRSLTVDAKSFENSRP